MVGDIRYGGMRVKEEGEGDGEGRMGKSREREMGMFVQEDNAYCLLHQHCRRSLRSSLPLRFSIRLLR